MKYIPIRDLDVVTNALNFESAECQVEGSCDLYTTKAAGGDRKLYKNIEHTLESQYESLVRFSASLSPPQASTMAPSLNLARSSPFGSLSQISSRRLYAYLIATLNASHPDYDFSKDIKPTDFHREKSLRQVMNNLDTTLYNLWPKTAATYGSPHWSSEITPSDNSNPTHRWNPKMWRLVDKEMDLKECSIYSYSPDGDPYDDEEGVIWSLNYFFFNKTRKRVCYLHLRGVSIIHSELPPPKTFVVEDWMARSNVPDLEDAGASKRARYWLGDRSSSIEVEPAWDEDDDDGMLVSPMGQSREPRLLSRDAHREFVMSADRESPESVRSRSKSAVRGMSEEIAASIDI